ncbi:class I SAM-dependent methyltransferase [Cohnella terricola]|uniref:Class I SAM-dependent methyltransferase n=1 Tax=Cohnella terricola TaxID=1289167 RepID=A0A559JIM3_9BACL|nr:class I SAM-dependent methyltransferase [Cohnella terricola]TVX99725.1 class I SAM-dependent methyltransferase [Cohnella terricola]
MPDHDRIYKQEAARYHELIDSQPNLKSVVEEIRPIRGLDIADLGAGTGRLAAVLAPEASSLIALDASEAMLGIAAERLRESGLSNWSVQVADHRRLPLADRSVDLIVSGWSICYLTSSNVPDWERNLDQVIAEIKRVLRPGGTAIIFETLGTGSETPSAPDFLRPYYAKLTETYGFAHRWIRMDYAFDNPDQAERLTRFFFGDELADKVAEHRLVRVPECAGIWWLTP